MAVEPVGNDRPADRFGPDQTLSAPELLRAFNRAGVLAAADVHVARTLGELTGVDDESVLLAAALAVRAPRMGHVFADIASAPDTIEPDTDDGSEPPLPWPASDSWIESVRACRDLVGVVDTTGAGTGGAATPAAVDATRAQTDAVAIRATVDVTGIEPRPLRLDGTRLYLDRYWREERALASALSTLANSPVQQLELVALADLLERLMPDPEDGLQRAAAACGLLRGLTVIAGGPGTGKTTTVAMLLAALFEQATAGGGREPLVALCAPTGKAAARLQEAIHQGASSLPVSDTVRQQMLRVRASTIHRLLGWLPGGRFRHHASNRLPHDLVIVDETSMVALSLITRLVGAVRSDARMVLVGDPDQLTAIEAGAVLQDIVGPAAQGSAFGPGMRPLLQAATGVELPGVTGVELPGVAGVELPGVAGVELPGISPGSGDASAHADPTSVGNPRFGDGVVVLRRGHRFGSGIGRLAEAIRLGDGDGAISALEATPEEITWVAEAEAGTGALRPLALSTYGDVAAAARAGDAGHALSALDGFRILCAHRRGTYGVNQWTARVEQWLADEIEGFRPGETGLVGRPLLLTENDHELRLNNGDTGVIVEGMGAVFERDGEYVGFAPSRLGSAAPLYAMTIHKSQGSQFDTAAVILPDPSSRILTRELLYTAVTRARRRLILLGAEESIRAAVSRPVARATGLRELLWSDRVFADQPDR